MTETTPLALNYYLAEVERQAAGCILSTIRHPAAVVADGSSNPIRRLAAMVAGLRRRAEPAPLARP